MKIKLLIDEDVHSELAHALRNRGFDVVHTQELDRKGSSDLEQLEYATSQQRCLVTFNMKDFVILHNRYMMENKSHAGIIVSKQLPFRETFRRMLQKLQHFSEKTMANRIEFL